MWSRTVALYDESKADMYEMQVEIGQEMVDLIIEHGDEKNSPSPRGNKAIILSRKQLEKLRQNKDSEIARAANKLWAIVFSSESNLLSDEMKILADLGVDSYSKFSRVTLFERTGRVCADWEICIPDPEDVMLVGLLAPPDNGVRRKEVEKWLKANPAMENAARDRMMRRDQNGNGRMRGKY